MMNRIERDVYTELEAAALAALLLLRELGHNGPSFLVTERLRRALDSVAVIHGREERRVERRKAKEARP